ncbi:GreA/GreB family elongation factor [candidate division WOR-3 bacterium]|nr:GreA/GreB family elongation factor [candidate division WOR-3 bacterium]
MDSDMRAALEHKNNEKLQDRWTDMVLDATVPVTAFTEITDTLHKHGNTDFATSLLDMLASHYDSERMYDRAIAVCKHLFVYRKEDPEIRQRLVDLYRKRYLDSEHLNEYLERSGVTTGEPIMKSLARLDEFLAYDIGTYFYFERYGVGHVIAVNPGKKEIVLDFERKKRHFLALDVARGLLTPLHQDHFLYIKHTRPELLQEMAEKKPMQVVITLLKSWHEPLTGAEIKSHLKGIIEETVINKFWDGVRKNLEKNPHIETRGRTNKAYSYAETEVDKTAQARVVFIKAKPREKYALAQDYVRTMPELMAHVGPELVATGNKVSIKDPSLAVDIYLFCAEHDIHGDFTYTVRELLEDNEAAVLLKKISDPAHQKHVLDMIQDMNPATWTKLFKQLMLTVNQPKVLDEIHVRLQDHANILKDVFFSILSVPKNAPYAYQWMLKKMAEGLLPEYVIPAFIPRIIESLDHVTGIRALVLKVLSLENFDRIMKQADPDEARRVLDTISMNETLEEYQKNDLIRIVLFHHPALQAQKTEVIYTTAHALKQRQAELEHLLHEEIPANKKEISRAREYGDLSENFEYKAAREKQAQLMEKVRVIEQELAQVKIIDPMSITTDKVMIGTRVVLTQENGQKSTYTILGRWDTDLENFVVSNEAPIAQQLLGKKTGDTVTIHDTPCTIVRIERAL